MSARLVTTAEFLDLLGAEPEPEPDEVARYAPASAADVVRVAAQAGWWSGGRWLRAAVPADPD